MSSHERLRRVPWRQRRAATRALGHVAALPPRVSLRAGADGHRLRPRAGRGAARRAARGLVHAARQGPAREQPRPAAVRHRGARGLRGGDLAAADRVHQDPAALQGQGHDRPGIPRGAAAGDHRHDRAPGAAGIPGPAVRAAGADLHPRPHVLLGVLHGGLDPAARHHRGAARHREPGADPAGAVRRPHGRGHLLAPGRRADRAGARRAGRPARAAPVHAVHHRLAWQGTPGARPRPRAGAAPPGIMGRLVRPGRRRQDPVRGLVRGRLGDLRARLHRGDRPSSPRGRTRRPRRRSSC